MCKRLLLLLLFVYFFLFFIDILFAVSRKSCSQSARKMFYFCLGILLVYFVLSSLYVFSPSDVLISYGIHFSKINGLNHSATGSASVGFDCVGTFAFSTILSVNKKLPLLKFRYFGNYNRNPDSYFTFHVSGILQTRL